jgi:hypothetical protein
MKFLFFLTAKYTKIAQSCAKSNNRFFAALCGCFATFAVIFFEAKVTAINCRVLTLFQDKISSIPTTESAKMTHIFSLNTRL